MADPTARARRTAPLVVGCSQSAIHYVHAIRLACEQAGNEFCVQRSLVQHEYAQSRFGV